MHFNLYFRESSKFFSFEVQSVGTMWTVISMLTKAYTISDDVQQNEETHLWAMSYAEKFKLSDEQTNLRTKNNNEQQQNDVNTKKKPKKKSKKQTESAPKNVVEQPSIENIYSFSSNIREGWIQKQLKARESEFTELREFR